METTMGKNTGDAASSNVIGKTADSAHEAVDKLARAAAPVIDRLAASAHQAVDRIASSGTPAAEWIEGNVRRVKESPERIFGDAKQRIMDNPMIALGAAILAGILISELTRHRDR